MAAHQDQVGCRAFGHAWPSEPDPAPSMVGAVGIKLRCTRCTTLRFDQISKTTGLVVSRRYIYPEGYRRTRVETPPRAEFRLEFFRFNKKLLKAAK